MRSFHIWQSRGAMGSEKLSNFNFRELSLNFAHMLDFGRACIFPNDFSRPPRVISDLHMV